MIYNKIVINKLNSQYRKTDREYIEDYNYTISWSRERLFEYYSAVETIMEDRSTQKRLYITRCAPTDIFKQ